MFFAVIILLIPFILFVIRQIHYIKNEFQQAEQKAAAQAKAESEAKAAEKRKLESELNKAQLNFQEKCKDNGIENLDSEENCNKARIIAKALNLPNVEMALQKYQKSIQESIERPKQISLRSHQKDYERSKKLASITGKNRYLMQLAKCLSIWQASAEKYRRSEKEAINSATASHNSLPKKTDPYIIGGLASGIAGPAAALFAALETQKENERQSNMVSSSEYAMAHAAISNILAKDDEYFVSVLKRAMKPVERAMFDDSDEEEKFSCVEIDKIEIKEEMLEAEYMEIKVHTAVNKPYMFVNTTGRLDGSMRVVVVEDGIDIGDGFFSAYGAGEPDLEMVGFDLTASKKRSMMSLFFFRSKDILLLINSIPNLLWTIPRIKDRERKGPSCR